MLGDTPSETPLMLNVWAATVAVGVQVPPGFEGCSPAGKTSANATPVIPTVFGLVSVSVMVVD